MSQEFKQVYRKLRGLSADTNNYTYNRIQNL